MIVAYSTRHFPADFYVILQRHLQHPRVSSTISQISQCPLHVPTLYSMSNRLLYLHSQPHLDQTVKLPSVTVHYHNNNLSFSCNYFAIKCTCSTHTVTVYMRTFISNIRKLLLYHFIWYIHASSFSFGTNKRDVTVTILTLMLTHTNYLQRVVWTF